MSPLPSGKSLSFVLSACFAGLSLASTALSLVVLETSATHSMRKQLGDKLAELAYQTTNRLDQGLFERRREVELISKRPYILDPHVSRESKESQLNQIQATYPTYSWIGITDMQGKITASTNGLLYGENVATRPWWKLAQQGVHLGDVHEAKLLAKKLPLDDGEPTRFIDIGFPLLGSDGKPIGVIGVHLSFAWARGVRQSIIEPAQSRANVDAIILSRSGKVLLGPAQYRDKILQQPSVASALAGHRKYTVERWDDGKDYLVGYSKSVPYQNSPGLGWAVLVRQELSEAYAPIRQLQLQVLSGGVAVSLLFAAFALYAARRIARPLQALAGDAIRIQRGEANELTALPDSYREVNELGSAFTSLLANLRHNETALLQSNADLERKVEERTAALSISEHHFRTLADNLPLLVAYVDAEERYRSCNQHYCEWFGTTQENVIGATVEEVIGPEFYKEAQPYIKQALAGERVTFITELIKNAQKRFLERTYIPHLGEDGVAVGFYVMTQDITEAKNLQLRLQHDVLHDPLTGLPNRVACMHQIEGAIARALRYRKAAAVLFLDVNKFKHINDTYGHDVGDLVLVEFAARLKKTLRDIDTVARLSGDEFVVVIEGLDLCAPAVDSRNIAAKIHAVMLDPVTFAGRQIKVSTSIGIAVYDGGNTSPDELLKQADTAMYEAKGKRPVVTVPA